MAKVIPKAKGKIKRERVSEDEQALKEWEERELSKVTKSETAKVGRSEISTKEVLNILADEVEEIYEMNDARIDRMNSVEKARTIWLEIKYGIGATVKEKDFGPLPLCKKHAE